MIDGTNRVIDGTNRVTDGTLGEFHCQIPSVTAKITLNPYDR